MPLLRASGVASLLSVFVLTACAVVPPAPTGAAPSRAAAITSTPAPQESEQPPPTAPDPVATDVEDIPVLGAESGGPAAGYFPTSAGAIDATSYGDSWFASASGYIYCRISSDAASCEFPLDMDRSAVPSQAETCTGAAAQFDVVGVAVTAGGAAHYSCGTFQGAIPSLDQGDHVEWWTATEFVPLDSPYDGSPLVVLPYGQKLTAGDLVCESAETGLSCGDLATGQGFTVEIGGVHFLKR